MGTGCDIVGSVYGFRNTKSMDIELISGASNFAYDSVMTLAVAKWLLEDEQERQAHWPRPSVRMRSLSRKSGAGAIHGEFPQRR